MSLHTLLRMYTLHNFHFLVGPIRKSGSLLDMNCDINNMVETPQLENKICPYPQRHSLEEHFGGKKVSCTSGIRLLKLFEWWCPYKSLLP